MFACVGAVQWGRGMVLQLYGTVPAEQPMGHLSHHEFKFFHRTGLLSHSLPPASSKDACLHICIVQTVNMNTFKSATQMFDTVQLMSENNGVCENISQHLSQ